jgi:hypothetical protein
MLRLRKIGQTRTHTMNHDGTRGLPRSVPRPADGRLLEVCGATCVLAHAGTRERASMHKDASGKRHRLKRAHSH